MAEACTRKCVTSGGTLLLVASLALAATSAEAVSGDQGLLGSEDVVEEIRLDVPTSIAFDPFDGDVGGKPPAVEESPPAETPWTRLVDLPRGVFDNRIHPGVMGGNDGTQVLDETRYFDPDVSEWVEAARLPSPRQAPATGFSRYGEVVMAGGWDENGDPTGSTYYFDPGSDDWVFEWDEMPSARAAAGYASFIDESELYVIGGCTTADCGPVSDSVFRFDWWGGWSEVADYPVPVAFPSCGAWKQRIYCTGGHDGTEGISDSYVYDRRTDVWSPLPEPPTDSWGTQHTMADGVLMVNGGEQGGAVSNNTFGYNVKAGAWIDLPNSSTARYRGAGGCWGGSGLPSRFISVGGLNGTDSPVAQAEVLPGLTACGDKFIAPVVSRHAGDNRYGTAAEIARLRQGSRDTVFVTTGQNFPDALAATARAGSLEAPILLTRSDTLREETRAELERLSPQSVIVVGGPGSVSDDVLRLIEDASGAGSVRRLAGTNRYGTAAAVTAEVKRADTVFVATGADFPDALAGAAWAGAVDAPLLLVKQDGLPAPARAQLERLTPERIVVLGGTQSVSAKVARQLRGYGAVERISGGSRWETAALVSAEFPGAERIGVASGRNWPDALTGAAHAGGMDTALLLVDTDQVPAPSHAALGRLGPDSIDIYGGTRAVTTGVFRQLRTLYD